jgi:hypothetical protein
LVCVASFVGNVAHQQAAVILRQRGSEVASQAHPNESNDVIAVAFDGQTRQICHAATMLELVCDVGELFGQAGGNWKIVSVSQVLPRSVRRCAVQRC